MKKWKYKITVGENVFQGVIEAKTPVLAWQGIRKFYGISRRQKAVISVVALELRGD